jgi:ABC-type transport system substrate-binding protein
VRERRLVLKRNPYYRGRRRHHVDRFVVESIGSETDVLGRVERGQDDVGFGLGLDEFYFDKDRYRRLVHTYGVNKSQFWVKPGFTLISYVLNTSRPLFRSVRLRKAVNFAVNRAVVRGVSGSRAGTLTDQYLPSGFPGFRPAKIYPLDHSNLTRAKTLARGETGNGKAILYTLDLTGKIAEAQVIQKDLAKIGLDVELKPITPAAYYERLGNETKAWDIAWFAWEPDYLDPSTYLNSLFEGHADANFTHFDSPKYNHLLHRAARLQGRARYTAYGKLDVQLAHDAAPAVAIQFLNQATLVSKRVDRRCVILRRGFDLAAACLKR